MVKISAFLIDSGVLLLNSSNAIEDGVTNEVFLVAFFSL